MARGHRNHFNLFFLLMFLMLLFSVNFLHTENFIQASKTCPACHFQGSTLMTAQINFFHLPHLVELELLQILESSPAIQAFIVIPSSRSPPNR
ncbi:MAG: hypothetical protein ACE5LV_10565 [Candidatus Aminicenantales bacterium]